MHFVSYWTATEQSSNPPFDPTTRSAEQLNSMPDGIFDSHGYAAMSMLGADEGTNYGPRSICDPESCNGENGLIGGTILSAEWY